MSAPPGSSPFTANIAEHEIVTPSPEVPVQRARLSTADTPVMRNMPLDGKVIETSPIDILDDASLVSSLSNDDSHMVAMADTTTQLLGTKIALPTPREISFVDSEESPVPLWLQSGDLPPPPPPPPPSTRNLPNIIRRAASAQSPVPHVKPVVPSPHIPRPNFGRIKSCPTTMDVSIASSSRASHTLPLESLDESATTPFSAIPFNDLSLLDGSSRQSTTDPFFLHNPHSKLLGHRPRRHVRSKSSASGSVASTVSLTAPTASSVTTASSSTLVTQQHHLNTIAGGAHRESGSRKKTSQYVREEFKYVLNRMSSPIRKIKKQQETSSVDLRRSQGCLT